MEKLPSNMRIVQLIAENVKRLKAVEITPEGNIVELTGRNKQGKTTILDSIAWALGGEEFIQDQPIRTGQKKARIKLNLGEITVERRFTEKGSSLIVESAAGARYTSPQTMLDDLKETLCFDPMAFSGMRPREQLDELKRIVPSIEMVEKLETANNIDYNLRTTVNRDAKAARIKADAIKVDEPPKGAIVDEQALLNELTAASATNTDIERRRGNRAAAEQTIATKRADAVRVRKAAVSDHHLNTEVAETTRREALVKAKRDYDAAVKLANTSFDNIVARLDEDKTRQMTGADTVEAEANKLEQELKAAPALPEAVDAEAIRVKLEDARAANKEHTAFTEWKKLNEEAEKQEKYSAEITERMELRITEIGKAVSAAKMPVEGLGFDFTAGHVTLNGVPFQQASSAEQVQASLGIAIAANPKLRIARIKEGSFLDKAAMKELAAIAKAHNFQIWVERVDESGTVGIEIEDGMVKAVHK